METQQPIIVFFTFAGCSHCRNFRGLNGKPSDDKEWCSSLIREYLCGTKGTTSGRRNLCSKIIEVHDFSSGANVENIAEFNIHTLIPSDMRVDEDFMDLILEDQKELIGDSIVRISLRRKLDNTIIIDVEIDGEDTDRRCDYIRELAEKYFIWDRVVEDISNLRDFFHRKSDKSFEECCTSEIISDTLYEIIMRDYDHFIENPEDLDKILKFRYNYDWLLGKIFPKRIRELECFYPSWMLVLPSEWKKGLDQKQKVYAKIKNVTSTLNGTRFTSKITKMETVLDMIKQYYAGRLSLIYSDSLVNNNQSIPSKLASMKFNSLHTNLRDSPQTNGQESQKPGILKVNAESNSKLTEGRGNGSQGIKRVSFI